MHQRVNDAIFMENPVTILRTNGFIFGVAMFSYYNQTKNSIMKEKLIKLIFLSVLIFTVSFSASAQIYVEIRPRVPVIVRPPQPGPVYVWVNEEWEPSGSSYRYSGGHWTPPPQPGYYRKSGYWVRTSKGQKWVKGSWYKKQPGNKGKHKGHYKKKHKN